MGRIDGPPPAHEMVNKGTTPILAESGEFLPGAVVSLKGTAHRAVTGSDGVYRLAGVPPGTYELIVSYVGYADYEKTVVVPENGDTVQPVTLKPDLGNGSEIVVRGYLFGTSKALNDQKESANIKNVISEEMIASIDAQLRDCRIFVSDDVVRSIADGARVRHGGGLLAADNGRLREVKVWRAGEKDKPTSEYMAVRDLVTRWKKAAKRKNH